jgi:hypothetical protein
MQRIKMLSGDALSAHTKEGLRNVVPRDLRVEDRARILNRGQVRIRRLRLILSLRMGVILLLMQKRL